MSPEEEDAFLRHWQFVRNVQWPTEKTPPPPVSPLRLSSAIDITRRVKENSKCGDVETLFVTLVHFSAYAIARTILNLIDVERATQLHNKVLEEFRKRYGILWTDTATVTSTDQTDRVLSSSAIAVAAMQRHTLLLHIQLGRCSTETAEFVRKTLGIWNSDPGPLDINSVITSIRSAEAYTKFCFALLTTGHYELFSFLASDTASDILLDWERLHLCGADAKNFLIAHWHKSSGKDLMSSKENLSNVLMESSNLDKSEYSGPDLSEEAAMDFAVDKADSSRAVDLAYFRAEKSNIYRNFSVPKGLVMIINNEIFKSRNLLPRMGSRIDEECITKLFTDLGYYVMPTYKNLKHDEMLREAREFALNPAHRCADSAVIVVLTHGENDCLLGVNGRPITTHEFLSCFDARSAPMLAGKPKLFIMQACRGANFDLGTHCPVHIDDADAARSQSPTGNGSALSAIFSFFGMSKSPRSSLRSSKGSYSPVMLRSSFSIPNNSGRLNSAQMRILYPPDKYQLIKKPVSADMIVAYATVPHHVSWRNTVFGSWFIQSVCKVFAQYARYEDLLTMLTRVNKLVSNEFESTNDAKAKQIPEFSVRLEKKFYLFPGVTSED